MLFCSEQINDDDDDDEIVYYCQTVFGCELPSTLLGKIYCGTLLGYVFVVLCFFYFSLPVW